MLCKLFHKSYSLYWMHFMPLIKPVNGTSDQIMLIDLFKRFRQSKIAIRTFPMYNGLDIPPPPPQPPVIIYSITFRGNGTGWKPLCECAWCRAVIYHGHYHSYHGHYTAQKATIHQVTTMLAISKTVLFKGHNHLLTTSTDDPTLWLLP